MPRRKKYKSDLCIAIYEFNVSRYEFMSDIAIAREPRGSLCSSKSSGKPMFQKLGFNDLDDYADTYPGKFHDYSKIVTMYMKEPDDDEYSHGCDGQCEYCNITVYVEDENSYVYEYFRRHDKHSCGLWDHFTLNPIPFVVPTLEELSECVSIKKFKHNDLWFCSDWSENNNS